MLKALEKFGFGPSFLRWVKTLYTNIRSSVCNGGWVSGKISLGRGVRQGCPLSEGMWIGKYRESKEMPSGMSWPSNPIKALGIYFGNDSTICEYLNWEHKIGNIKKLLDIWKRRKMTLIGKILILKSLVIPKIVYTASVLSSPDEIISKVKSKFVWDNKPDKIKRNTLIYNQGCLKMPDIKSLRTALLARWSYRLANHSFEK